MRGWVRTHPTVPGPWTDIALSPVRLPHNRRASRTIDDLSRVPPPRNRRPLPRIPPPHSRKPAGDLVTGGLCEVGFPPGPVLRLSEGPARWD
ncbi:hypothetical protein Plo01_23050 [Planobispora longispora]|uniref:Uncharacterized protein n=1 Tax=Planobispora longispora TaxID=28887 RepID=A0A8J3RKK8_9ACTN|nr:hypothetical protein Plo01_23050 [Planobispora longispora]